MNPWDIVWIMLGWFVFSMLVIVSLILVWGFAEAIRRSIMRRKNQRKTHE